MKVDPRQLAALPALALAGLVGLSLGVSLPWVLLATCTPALAVVLLAERSRSVARLRSDLARSELRLETMGSGTAAILWEYDVEEARFTYVSPEAERYGYPLERWADEGFWYLLIHPEDREATIASCREAVERREDHRLSYRILTAEGRVAWVEDVVLCPDELGAQRLRGVLIDVSDLKRAEQAHERAASIVALERERLESTLEAGELGAWEWLPDEGLVLLDWRHARTLNSPFGGARVRSSEWLAAIHPDDLDRVQDAARAYLRGDSSLFEVDFRLQSGRGEWHWLQARGKAVERREDGRVLRMAGTHTDVSQAKQHELELERLRYQADEANRAKSAFLANMSHEIRTPLTAILGYSDLLIDTHEEDDDPRQRRQMLRTVRTAGQHLLTVINDILDLSKIEAGAMSVESVETDLVGLVSEIAAVVRPRALGKGVELAVSLRGEAPERIHSDPTRLRQILLNLLGNAAKFTEEGRVEMRVQADQGRLRFEIEDTGPGMEPGEVEALFQPFSQLDPSVSRRFGGTGLGLSICRRLAHLLGGEVRVEWTEPGRGSCFVLDLPLKAVEGTRLVGDLGLVRSLREEPGAGGPVRLTGRVLLVEDGPVNRRLLTRILERVGLEVETAENGVEGLEILEEDPTAFDLVLTDIQMPRMDGYSLTRALREQGFSRPIVALTAHAMAEDRQRCMAAGCDDYVTKPVDQAVLISTCRRWLERQPRREAA